MLYVFDSNGMLDIAHSCTSAEIQAKQAVMAVKTGKKTIYALANYRGDALNAANAKATVAELEQVPVILGDNRTDGLLMTASGSRSRNQMKLPSFPGIAEVRASIHGRLRLTMPAIIANGEAALRMKAQMESTGAVREVRLNRRIGSVLFLYDERQVEAAVVEGAAIRLMGLDNAIRKPPVSRMEKGLNVLWDSVNHGVLEATNGLMDGRMLAGSALTVAALRSMIVSGAALPGAMTLLWWASNIFRGRSHE
jgi:hypothetical protein